MFASSFFPQLPLPAQQVAAVFVATLGRAPEFGAMQHYVQKLQHDKGLAVPPLMALARHVWADAVANHEVPYGVGFTAADQVRWVYRHALGREPEAGGLAYWAQALEQGTVQAADLVVLVVQAALAVGGADAQALQHRVYVAERFAEWHNSKVAVLPQLAYSARDVLAGVGATAASLEAGLARLFEITQLQGKTFMLTLGPDVVAGTPGDDLITMPQVWQQGGWVSTFSVADRIDAGLGHDVLQVSEGQGSAAFYAALASVRGVEQLTFTAPEVSMNAASLAGFSVLGLAGLGAQAVQMVQIQDWQAGQVLSLMPQAQVVLDVAWLPVDAHWQVAQGALLDVYLLGDAQGQMGQVGGELVVSGAGSVVFDAAHRWVPDNHGGALLPLPEGKFDTVNLQGHTGLFEWLGSAPERAETVKLGEGELWWWITRGTAADAASSSVASLDTLDGYRAESVQWFGLGRLQGIALPGEAEHLAQAWQLAASQYAQAQQAGVDAVWFWWQGNTYLYADTVGPGQGVVNAGDFALRLIGEHDLGGV